MSTLLNAGKATSLRNTDDGGTNNLSKYHSIANRTNPAALRPLSIKHTHETAPARETAQHNQGSHLSRVNIHQTPPHTRNGSSLTLMERTEALSGSTNRSIWSKGRTNITGQPPSMRQGVRRRGDEEVLTVLAISVLLRR